MYRTRVCPQVCTYDTLHSAPGRVVWLCLGMWDAQLGRLWSSSQKIMNHIYWCMEIATAKKAEKKAVRLKPPTPPPLSQAGEPSLDIHLSLWFLAFPMYPQDG